MKKFVLFVLALFLCAPVILCAGCNNNNKTKLDREIHSVYAIAVENGEKRSYEEWLASLKGEKGDKGDKGEKGEASKDGNGIASIEKLQSVGLVDTYKITFTDGTSTTFTIRNGAEGAQGEVGPQGPQGAPGKDAACVTYKVEYDYGAAQSFFVEYDEETKSIKSYDFVKSNEWLITLPSIKDEFKNSFLGWFIIGTNRQIENYTTIGANITLEARFDRNTLGLAGLYENGKYVKSWSQLKNEYPNAFVVNGAISGAFSESYFTQLSGEFVIDESISAIGASAFRNCSKLTSIIMPNSITTIGSLAFLDCASLTEVKMSESISLIDSFAFSNCGIQSIVIPKSVKTIGFRAFDDCDSFDSIYYMGTEDEWDCIDIDDKNDKIKSATIYYL